MTSAQLAAAGLGYGAVSNRVTTGRLHRKYRGVYAVGQPRLSQEGAWMAAVLACGAGSALSHLSAAVHWRIWRRRVTGIDVLAPKERRVKGVRVHICRVPDPRDVTRRDHIPVTTVARTLVDLTDVLDQYQLANVIHEAAYWNLFNARAAHAAIERANGRHRLSTLHASLQAHAEGSAGTRSDLEDRFRALAERAGLPEPRINTHIGDIEVDFHWPDRKLCVEVDGPAHDRPRTKRDDRAKDQALTAAGHTVLRFTDEDVDHRPSRVIARLKSLV